MDHEIIRFVLALLLSGLVLLAWQYYRTAANDKPSRSIMIVQQGEESDIEKTDARKDLSDYKHCGFLKTVVYPIYKALEYINGKIDNPGIALVLITLVIRLLLTPLTIKQIRSSKSMAELKVEIEKIKNEYKENPLEMQKAVGAFFREKGINPLSSLVLAVIQIPLFFALYKIVREAHLFSGAPFVFWIKDLGIPDPYYILPALAGLTMLLGAKLTGNTGTQVPGWLTGLFPIIFTFFLLNQPSALALYMLVGSLIQFVINFAAYR